jgi:GT2 family glycosyltransferase
MKYKLSILIPVFGQSSFTKACLEDLIKLGSDHEIILYNNGSKDGTKEVIEDMMDVYNVNRNNPFLDYIDCNVNTGFAVANNELYSISQGKNILFLNNDIRVKSSHKNWTNKIIKQVEKGYLVSPDAGLLDKNFNFVKEGRNIDLNNKLSYLSGWCLGGSRKTFNKLILNQRRNIYNNRFYDKKGIGPFWEKLFLYFEDDDLSFRARELGIKMKIVKVPVHHFGRVTGRTLNMQENYLNSRKIFVDKWYEKFN